MRHGAALPRVRRACDRGRRPFVVVGLSLALVIGGVARPARAELRRIVAEGAVAAASTGALPAGPLREAARQRALAAAVVEAGLQLLAERGGLPGDVSPPADPAPTRARPGDAPAVPADPQAALRARVAAALDGSPLDYTSRHRMAEDLGLRPRLLVEDPAVSNEYAVRVEAQVDLDRVRQRLSRAGLLSTTPVTEVSTHRLELRELPSFAALTALRRALPARLAARALRPAEISSGRVVFVLTTPRSAAEVRSLLGGFAVEGVELAALPASEGDLVFAVRVPPPPPAPGAIPSVPDAMTDALGEERAMPIPAVPLPRPPPGGLERSGVD